jgi:WD40 repeat protein
MASQTLTQRRKGARPQNTNHLLASLRLCVFALSGLALVLVGSPVRAAESAGTNFSAVAALFEKHCLDCHAAQDPEGNLVLESFETLMKGGESGSVIVPRKSSESLLVKMIEGTFEKEGKKKIMPPGSKRKKLDTNEIALIKSWIDAGANPDVEARPKELVIPKIIPKVSPRRAVNAVAFAPKEKIVAIARDDSVELQTTDTRAVLRTLTGHRGVVNALVFSADGKQLFAGAGIAGVFGEVRQWNVADGTLIRTFEGHKDAIYGLALSPDGKILATGSYDQKIKFWDVAAGTETKTLSGHNGAVFALAFRRDGKILASASADRTVKLWDVASGERRDTLSQSLKDLYAVAFSPDGKRLAAGGVDNRIRVWEISEKASETTNPLLYSRFAHEGAILKIVYSSDGKSVLSSAADRTVRLWDAAELKERLLFEKQPDWPPALAFVEDKSIIVGRLDGTTEYYDTTSGKVVPVPKPEIVRAEPRGIQRGLTTRVKLTGSNLVNLIELKLHNPKLKGDIEQRTNMIPSATWISVSAADDLAPGPVEISLVGKGGETSRLKLYVDDLPQLVENERNSQSANLTNLPVSFWGTIDPLGDYDEEEFSAKAGDTLVFDLNAKSLGSKANAVLTLSDAEGKVLASNNDFDGTDPFLAYTFKSDGTYKIRVHELMLGASKDHFYRLTVGKLPYVTGCYPMSVPANSEHEVELIGYNLPSDRKVKIKAGKAGEMDLPLDANRFRSRKTFKILVGDDPELVEKEPNDAPDQATQICAPAAVNGKIWSASGEPDSDLFRFDSKAGQTWVIETTAAQRGSPVDTKIEVLHPNGKPVERIQLQALRDSAVTFRGIDSTTPDCRVENWEEMELNEYLYLQGEVVKIFRMPQGPDSGFLFYTSGVKRRAYFDTSATAHALDEPCYVVEPHPPGTKLVENGLPTFHLYYANDDDGDRKLGSDSKLFFTAPKDGAYLVRVTDTRGYGGDRFTYRLAVRPAKPDFKVKLNGANPMVNAGSGRSFSVTAERIDGFAGDITVNISKMPKGFSVSTPLVIQAGHSEAKGTIYAALDAVDPGTNSLLCKVKATASINGSNVVKKVNNFGTIKLGEKPKLYVALEPPSAHSMSNSVPVTDSQPFELTIAPGQTIPAWLKIKRNGHEDLVTFTVENLPHGVIVDNIGLNGVLIPKGQNEREIFLTAAKWVPETDRLCYAIENQAGNQTSLPVMLHVRKPGSKIAAK